MKSLIIIPAFNEEANIASVVEELRQSYPQFDYLVVNDGSEDRTAQICHKNGYSVVDLPVNLGLAGAVQTGMRYAMLHHYDTAVQLDADGQHRPEFIQPMLDKLIEGYDIVVGSRFVNEKKPMTVRMMGSRLISFAIRLMTGKKITDPTSGLRAYNKRMIREFAIQINHAPEPDTMSYLIRKGANIAEIQVVMDERTAGESYLNFTRSITYMLRMGISILMVQPFRNGQLQKVDKEEEYVPCQ